jgi:hypothetical protein
MHHRPANTQTTTSTTPYTQEITMLKRFKPYTPYLVMASIAVIVYGIVAASFFAFPVATR